MIAMARFDVRSVQGHYNTLIHCVFTPKSLSDAVSDQTQHLRHQMVQDFSTSTSSKSITNNIERSIFNFNCNLQANKEKIMKSITEGWEGNFMNSASDSHSLLATAITETVDQSESPIDTGALLDSGSQLNFITTNLAKGSFFVKKKKVDTIENNMNDGMLRESPP